MKYDREEKDILDAYENGSLKISTPSKKEIESIKAAAKNTFKKDKRITIRLYDHDYKGIQKKCSRIIRIYYPGAKLKQRDIWHSQKIDGLHL